MQHFVETSCNIVGSCCEGVGQMHATSCNIQKCCNMLLQGCQTYATHCTQQCYKMLLWNVECVWLGPKNTNQWPRHDWISESCWGNSNKIIQLNFNALIVRWKEELQWSQKQIRKWIGLSFQKMRLCLWVSKLNKHRVKILHKGYVWEVSLLYCFVP